MSNLNENDISYILDIDMNEDQMSIPSGSGCFDQ